jgi:hypothetical protein
MAVTVRHCECQLLSDIWNVSYCQELGMSVSQALGMSVTVRHWEWQLLSGIGNVSYCQTFGM